MADCQTMNDGELAYHIFTLKNAKEAVEKQFGGLAHSVWDTIPAIMGNLGGDHPSVIEYHCIIQNLQDAESERSKRGRVI